MNPHLSELDGQTALKKRLNDDMSWCETAAEILEYKGKLVIVRNKRVIAIGTDAEVLLDQAAALEGCPRDELLVVTVSADGFFEIPH